MRLWTPVLFSAAPLVASAARRTLVSSSTDPSTGATTTTTTTFPVDLDDNGCTFSWTDKKCVPATFCSYQYAFGDTSFDQSCRLVPDTYDQVPQQIHLAYAGATPGTGMTISWTTYGKTSDIGVWLGTSADALALVSGDDNVAIDTRSYYSDAKYELFSHHATLAGLKPHTTYYYKVGSSKDKTLVSDVGSFTTARATNDDAKSFTIAMYGDLGVDENAVATIKYINTKLPGKVDFIYHVGDISYADNAFLKASELLGFFYEETYNRWMDAMAPVMKTVPYMVSVGNHEAECHSPTCFLSSSKKDQLGNYAAYNARFKMPSTESGGVKNMWYSFDHGPLHFTSISSETDYDNAPSNSFTGRKYGGFGDQLTWLEADLKKADANRANTPWLIVSMHRAIYTRDECDVNGKPVNAAANAQKAFEALFIKYNVDIVVAGHVHLYERNLPTKDSKAVLDGVSDDKKTYTNPKAPVYLITGAAGNTEGHSKYETKAKAEWSAVIENEHYGINLVDVTRTQLKWTFVAADSGNVIDEFAIVKS